MNIARKSVDDPKDIDVSLDISFIVGFFRRVLRGIIFEEEYF